MEFLKKLNLEPGKLGKLFGLAVATVIGAVFIVSLFHSIFGGFRMGGGIGMMNTMPRMEGALWQGKSISRPSYGVSEEAVMYEGEYAGDAMYAKGGGMGVSMSMPVLSTRNMIGIMPPMPGGTVGNNAEEFEVADYNATFEANDLMTTCADIAGLKSKKEVIFENSYESDQSCYYSFKVEKDTVEYVLSTLKDLDPKDLSENIATIKRQLDDFTNETEILTKKLASVEATLTSALASYDEITRLATQTKDAESLAQIINSKIQVIERLSQERMNINQQLDYIARAKAEQLDKVDYTYFSVNVYQSRYFDWEGISDSWKGALQQFVWAINTAIQNATIGVLGFLFITIPYLIYLVFLVLAAKYGWRLAKYIWNK